MNNSIVLLGSTGSIGVNTLIIAKRYNIAIEALVAGNNIDLLNKQIKEHQPKIVAIANKADKAKVNHPNVLCGEQGILTLIEMSKSDTLVNALVGYAGLAPTLKATSLGKRVALANKESLVVAHVPAQSSASAVPAPFVPKAIVNLMPLPSAVIA